MALNIVFNNNSIKEWHVNNLKPLQNGEIEHIKYIQASGHELELIRNTFNGTIPDIKGYIMKWYGDIAKTIIANLF